MKNSIYIKISLVLILITIIYTSFSIFVITPKISESFTNLHIVQINNNLANVEELNTKVNEINQLIITFSLIMIFIVLFTILFIKKLLNPLSMLSKNVNLIKEGNLKIRNKIKSKDELGILALNLNNILDAIAENTKNLEHKIETSTAEIKNKLYYDELTGLKNRLSLIQDLKKDDFAALSLIDIQGFDDINELYGFEVGNEILIKVTKLLSKFAKELKVSLYRLDSDIFGIKDVNIHKFISYENFLKEIHDIFKEEIHVDSLDIDLFIYTTIGTSISQIDPLKSASIALKNAKSLGVQYLVYNKEIDTKNNIKKTMYWREKIKEALERDRVIPFFQAIYNRNNEIIKYESLMRIYDEIDNKPYYLSPGSFFEVAIKTKQYYKLNQRSIKKVFENIDKIGKDISINLSFADILNIEFNEFIKDEVNKLSEIQRKKIIFEILESDNISDYEILDDFIFLYRGKGIRIAIDDFGTGFSNFSHILKIKPDYIKIDGSLIKNINEDENSYQMVKSIVEFSKSLKITVIAEFIHSKEVYDIVKDLNVDEFQGYYLGKPKSLI